MKEVYERMETRRVQVKMHTSMLAESGATRMMMISSTNERFRVEEYSSDDSFGSHGEWDVSFD